MDYVMIISDMKKVSSMNKIREQTKYLDQYLNRSRPAEYFNFNANPFATAELRCMAEAVRNLGKISVVGSMVLDKLPNLDIEFLFRKHKTIKDYNPKWVDVVNAEKEVLHSKCEIKERALKLKEKLRRKRIKRY